MVSIYGAIASLAIAIFLIVRKVPAAYAMMFGAICGGIIGMVSLSDTMSFVFGGVQSIVPAIVRVMGAGVLAVVMIKSGSAETIAQFIIDKAGHKHSILAIIIATALITAVGVYGDISILTVAPIALSVARVTGYHKYGLLIGLIGGVKAGTVISPNPNSIAIVDAFDVPLTNLSIAGIPAFIAGIIIAFVFAHLLKHKGDKIDEYVEVKNDNLPNIFQAISAPLCCVVLLMLRPLFNIDIDPAVSLPLGAILGLLMMGKQKYFVEYLEHGINMMSGVVMLLIGTGMIAGIIENSEVKTLLVNLINTLGIPGVLLGPFACIFMGLATSSSTASTTLTSSIFKDEILSYNVSALSAGAMINSSSFVFDGLPHGALFHISAGCVNMDLKSRMNLIIYEVLIGVVMSITSIIIYAVIL